MIPRKEAQRLLAEYLAALEDAEAADDEELDYQGMKDVAAKVLQTSDLVLRGTENIEQKGRRYLTEGRLTVERVGVEGGWIVAQVRGSEGVHHLGYDPKKNQWRCTCQAGKKGRCSHLIALKLITTGGTT